MEVVVEETKIDCPHCKSKNCFQEDHKVEQNKVSSFLCMGCGYTTTSLNILDSEFVKNFEETCPELFKDIKFIDTTNNLVWYPTVINFPELGIIFPDGANPFDWKWRAVPVVAVTDKEKEKYPIPNKPGEFYETRADMENSRLYSQEEFQEACKYLKIIV